MKCKIYLSLLFVLFAFEFICNGQDCKMCQYVYPLKLSSSKRYLTDQYNMPFFWSGDAAWSLIAQLSSRVDAKFSAPGREAVVNAFIVK